jgi:hypothetical protein
MNPMLVAQVVGHSSLRMIEQVYSHLTIGDAHAAVMRLLTQEKCRTPLARHVRGGLALSC